MGADASLVAAPRVATRSPSPLAAAWHRAGPVVTVLAVVLVLWYAAAVWLNAPQVIERVLSNQPGWGAADLLAKVWAMDRPVLPAPHQIVRDLWSSLVDWPLDSPRNLLFHAYVTSSATLLGFVLGTLLGALLAVAIVHSRSLDRSLLPWVIASQTVPVLAIAPIIIVMLGSLGLTGLLPKSIISAYLCFFPVTVALVKGLRSPGVLEQELLHTYAASKAQTFWKLRVPASLPFLFPALRVGIAAGLVGAIVGELPTGAQAGLGARLLTGSYYGNTVQIWSALVMASLLGLALTGAVALAERALTPGAALMFGVALNEMSLAWLLPGLALLLAVAAWSVRKLAAFDAASAIGQFGTPLMFGVWVLLFWQVLTVAFDVPRVLLPAPSLIAQSLGMSWGVLAGDFVQTVLHSVLIGLFVGCTLGFVTGVLIDRSPFLQRGLLPIAALASTVPLVGIAPIMVMWFGFDWHSKAAVVVLMTFFPMLVNTLAGLAEAGHMERDLMRSYGAGYWRTLASLRIPVALPFVFNALKINSTLAMIGAIVAEFFGSPTAGLGFRISTEAARLNMPLVWAAIVVAALAGSLLYGALGWVERRATFWHPSIRRAS